MKRVVVTGGAGQIAYTLLFRIASGELFGSSVPISLQILDLPEMEKALEGVAMELQDCAFKPLKEINTGSDPHRLFEGADAVFLVGAKPRGPGMERKDLLIDNGKIFVGQGHALDRASSNVKVLVVGNPCNTNCLIAMHNAKRLSPKHFFAMTRLDQNRAAYQLAHKANVSVADVDCVIIWGNHSSTQVPDFVHAKIKGRPAIEVIHDRKWLEEEFLAKVQKRGAEVINARGKSSAASAANAALEGMRSLLEPTPAGQFYSMGVYTKGNPYGIDQDLIFSFPCKTNEKGDVDIVPHLQFDHFLKEKIAITQKELIEEREMVAHMLGR